MRGSLKESKQFVNSISYTKQHIGIIYCFGNKIVNYWPIINKEEFEYHVMREQYKHKTNGLCTEFA